MRPNKKKPQVKVEIKEFKTKELNNKSGKDNNGNNDYKYNSKIRTKTKEIKLKDKSDRVKFRIKKAKKGFGI